MRFSTTTVPPTASVFLISALISLQHVEASVGVVDIQDLLEPGSQHVLSSDNTDGAHSESPTSHEPWTHPPYCTRSTSLKNLGEQYCVYSNNRTSYNGISLVATPEVAEKAAQYVDEDPLWHFIGQDKYVEWASTSRPWAVVDIPGKDKGVVATRRIKQYETFMIDSANIVMDIGMEKTVSAKESLKVLKVAMERLKDPGIARALSSRHNEGKDSHEDLEESIMMANSFSTDIEGTSMRGLFPITSRMNHACNPNAFVIFSQSGISVGIKAYRDIQPGEEITISYLLPGLQSARRKEGLERWGFQCKCDLCAAAPSAIAASDARRARIESGEKEFASLWSAGKYVSATKVGAEVVELMKEEGLTAMLTDEYVLLARLHLLLGDRETAEEYRELAVELLANMGFLGNDVEEREWSLERLLEAFGQEVTRGQ